MNTFMFVAGLSSMIISSVYIWMIAVLTINPFLKDAFICSAIIFCMGIGLSIAGFVGGLK